MSAGIRAVDFSAAQNLEWCASKSSRYTALLHGRVIWLLLILTILTLRVRRGLALPDGRATFATCFTCFFRRPLVRHAPEMREFSTFTRDFALSVAVHGRESALACRHLTSVDDDRWCIVNAIRSGFRLRARARVKAARRQGKSPSDRPAIAAHRLLGRCRERRRSSRRWSAAAST